MRIGIMVMVDTGLIPKRGMPHKRRHATPRKYAAFLFFPDTHRAYHWSIEHYDLLRRNPIPRRPSAHDHDTPKYPRSQHALLPHGQALACTRVSQQVDGCGFIGI